jgi:hypothetical protein
MDSTQTQTDAQHEMGLEHPRAQKKTRPISRKSTAIPLIFFYQHTYPAHLPPTTLPQETMQKMIDEDNERYDNAVEEDPNLTHVAVVSQESYPVLPRIKISAQTIKRMIPGVNLQPDTSDKGPFGSWMYMMNAYAAEQLTLACITNPLTYTKGQRIIRLRVKCRRILDEANNNRANN